MGHVIMVVMGQVMGQVVTAVMGQVTVVAGHMMGQTVTWQVVTGAGWLTSHDSHPTL